MKSRVSKLVQLCALMVAIGLSVPGWAQSSSQYQSQVLLQLQLVQAVVAQQWGVTLHPTHEVFYVDLSNNTYQEVRYTLYAGVTYIFVGACDRDCSSLQLKLYDGYGQVIARDNGVIPAVSTTVAQSGVFYLRVSMHACEVQPCWAGIGVYR